MPIEIYTGKPGNGKTAFMMERMMAAAAEKDPAKQRPIFASGIDGLQPGIATVIADPRTWNDLDPAGPPECTCDRHPEPHAHVLRNGALWFVDEAWKWFGHLHDASRQATPLHVLALAEHRHRGIDMVWTTQGPNQLYPFARPLIADHYHHVRRFGTSFVEVYKWEELQDDVKSGAKRESAIRTTKALPKSVFGQYKSADVHTIKRKIPLRVFALPVMLVAAVGLVYLALQLMKPDAVAAEAKGQDGAQATASPEAAAARRGGPRWESPEAYVADHQPRIPALPWSAPVFDDRNATANPEIYCASSGAGLDAQGNHKPASCSCLTEQGTPYRLPDAECKLIARQGMPYNPYRERSSHEGSGGDGGAPPSAMAQRAASLPGAMIGADQVSGYGAFRPGQSDSAP